MIFNALQAVFMVLTLITAGYFIGRSKWNIPGLTAFLSKFIIGVTVPCTIISVFTEKLTKDSLSGAGVDIAAAFLAMGAAYALSVLTARAIKIDRGERGVFCMLFSLSNAGFMGLPVAEALFGAKGLLTALFYFTANNVLGNSIGYIGVCADGVAVSEGRDKAGAAELIRRSLAPPVIAVIIALILVWTKIQLPPFLNMSVSYLGAVTSPLALLFLGLILAGTGFSCFLRLDKKMLWVVIGRFIISPALMYCVALLLGLSVFDTSVYTVQTGLPAAVATTIFAKGEGANVEFAASGVVITTILSLVTIPVYAALLN